MVRYDAVVYTMYAYQSYPINMQLTFCGVQYTYIHVHIPTPVASAPTSVMAVQEGLTSIRVSWSPPTPLGDTTGYRIYYSGGSSGSEDVSDGSTDNYLLTGLQNGDSYTVSIVATSQHLPSESVVHNIALGETRGLMDHLMYKSYKCDIIHAPSHNSKPAGCYCDYHNSHLHHPFLECSQWLRGDQFRGDVASNRQ